MDFKGEYALAAGGKCYPLTLLDDCSRYLLGLWPLAEYAGGRRTTGITAAFSGARRTTGNVDGPWLDVVLQP